MTRPAQTRPAQTGPAQTGPAQTGPAQTGPAQTGPAQTGPAQTGPLVDLAARVLGAGVVAASDEAFGAKEHLVQQADPDLTPGRFSLVGELVDGWETRRRRTPGHDWAIVRLGVPGIVHRVVVDTRGFTGNFPARYGVDAATVDGYPDPTALVAPGTRWDPLVPTTSLAAAGLSVHEVAADRRRIRRTHVRLRQEPDGGVARLRVLGTPVPDPSWFDGVSVDLLAQGLGGAVTAWSDAFYTHPEVLIRPDLPRTMGEGWEARRRRDGGHDWVVLRLAAAATPAVLEVDTSCYVYNASSAVAVWAAPSGPAAPAQPPGPAGWFPLLPRTALQPDTRHRFVLGPLPTGVPDVGWLRVDAFPDAGLARLRLHGTPTPAGRAALHATWAVSTPSVSTPSGSTPSGSTPPAPGGTGF